MTKPKIDYDMIAKVLGADHYGPADEIFIQGHKQKLRQDLPKLVIQVLAMPADTNPHGDIFGGWLLSQMDIAGAIMAQEVAKNRVVTVGLDKMAFVKPVFVGDVLKCYVTIERIGNTSVTVLVEAYATRISGETDKVTEGKFSYVSIDPNRNPRPIKP